MQTPRPPHPSRPSDARTRHPARLAPALALLLLLASCADLTLSRRSESHGTFEATGLSVTVFSVDLPKRALDIARENVSDARQPNLVVEEVTVIPYLGSLDWILDIVSVRWAKISGTWGFPPEPATDEPSS